MINQIVDAISIKLNQVFGDGYKIYSDNVKQGLKEPCFFIRSLTTSNTPLLGTRSFRQNPFDIHFFPKLKNSEETNAVTEQLFDALEYITFTRGDLVRGTKMHAETVDGVLHFFVNYDLFLREEEAFEPMETIAITSVLKEGE